MSDTTELERNEKTLGRINDLHQMLRAIRFKLNHVRNQHHIVCAIWATCATGNFGEDVELWSNPSEISDRHPVESEPALNGAIAAVLETFLRDKANVYNAELVKYGFEPVNVEEPLS